MIRSMTDGRRWLLAAVALVWLLAAGAQEKVYDVTNYGAVGDGATDDAAAIQRAIDDCSRQGGGQVLLPAGRTFVAGPVELKSNVDFHLAASSRLLAHPDEGKYTRSAFKDNRGEGMMWLWCHDVENLSISGRGCIDGNGVAFMGAELGDSYELKPLADPTFDPRPHVLTLIGVRNLSIRDVTIREGAYWTVHLIGCDGALIDGISLLNNLKIRNGDGIDVDHSRHVRIANCHITSGDDCICLKNRREWAEYGPTHDIVVTNCVMASRSCAIKIGSENMDSISRVSVSNCIIRESNRGIGIQNRDEGTVSDVLFADIILDCRLWSDVWWGKAEPIYVTSYPRADGNHKDANWRFPKGETQGRCGEVSRIFFSNIVATSENGCFVGGDTPGKVNHIYFDNVQLFTKRQTGYPTGIYDLRPRRGEGFVGGKPYGVVVGEATEVHTEGVSVPMVSSGSGDQGAMERMLDEVNTFTGSAPSITQTAGLFGKNSEEWGQTIPAVLAPYGMNFWTPQTRATERKCVAPFYYSDTRFQGFRNSHWIVGGCTQDYGSFTLMAKGNLPLPLQKRGGRLGRHAGQAMTPEQWATPYSHAEETSHPYYYSVSLPEEELQAELTATSRAAIFRYSPASGSAGRRTVCLLLQPNSDEGQASVSIDLERHCVAAANPVHRIYQGWGESAGFAGHYVLQWQRQPVAYGVFDAEGVYPGETVLADREGVGAYLCFEVEAGQPLVVKAGSSFTDEAGALGNLQAEIPHWDFDRICGELRQAWLRRLSLLEAEGSDSAMLHKFYGALYRASFLPHAISDADGRYPAFAKGQPVMQLDGGTQYGDYSLWDTYRAVHPLINILTPTIGSEMMQSLVRMYEQGGWMPIFPCWNSYTAAMIGDHASSVIADAWVKGIRNFDIETAYRGMRQNAFSAPQTYDEYKNGMGRRALESYLRYGFIPLEDSVSEAFHQQEQVSRTLEYAYDDFCVAQVAKALGKEKDYQELMRRSENWRNVLNPATGYVCGRHADGTFLPSADAFRKQPYITEGAPCHYTWYVPHNPEGLMEAMGGKEKFVARLDSMFTCGRYWHGNEPCHQVAWLFNAAGEPWLTQQRVRHIIDTEYLDAPGGLSGNDDAGQMSSWLIFACMGFYPVCPAIPIYYIGSPVFPRLTLHLENGRTFTIIADDVSPQHIYVRGMTLNGQPLAQPYLSHDDIMRGGELRLSMGLAPS